MKFKINHILAMITFLLGALLYIDHFMPNLFAQTRLPGSDEIDKLEAAGTLLKILDTGIFAWGARLFAGLAIFSSGLALKEQRFAVAFICILGAIVIGTCPLWVRNIFAIGGGSVFE